MRGLISILLTLAALVLSPIAQEVTLLAGGSPEAPADLKLVRFFPDFRESRTLIMESLFSCDMANDCEKDKTISYKSSYGGVPFQYFIGKVNMNFRPQRLPANVFFHYVTGAEERFDVNILGLSRDSEFLIQYFRSSDRKKRLLRLTFRGEEGGHLEVANPYVLSQVKWFEHYKDNRNSENFFLTVNLRVTEVGRSGHVLLDDTLRLCPFSNPARTSWNDIFFSGSKKRIDAYRKFFQEILVRPDDHHISLIHSKSKFALKMDKAFKGVSEKKLFRLGYVDSEHCDLYFGYEFVKAFRMDFIIGFDKTAQKATLGFQTMSESPKPFGYWILSLGLVLVVIFSTIVLRTHYQAAPKRAEKERSDLEESLKDL